MTSLRLFTLALRIMMFPSSAINGLKSCLKSLRLLLISRFAEKSKHILLISLHARLIEWIHAKDIAADSASLLKEIEESTEVILVYTLYRD